MEVRSTWSGVARIAVLAVVFTGCALALGAGCLGCSERWGKRTIELHNAGIHDNCMHCYPMEKK